MVKLSYIISSSAAISIILRDGGVYAATVQECVDKKNEELTVAGDIAGLMALLDDPMNMAANMGCCEGEAAASDIMCNMGGEGMAVMMKCLDMEGSGLQDIEGCECGTVLQAMQGMGAEMAGEVAFYGDCCKEGTTAEDFNTCVAELEGGAPSPGTGITEPPPIDYPLVYDGLDPAQAAMMSMMNCFNEEFTMLLEKEECGCGTILETMKGAGPELAEEATFFGDCCEEGTTAEDFNTCVAELEGGAPSPGTGITDPAIDNPLTPPDDVVAQPSSTDPDTPDVDEPATPVTQTPTTSPTPAADPVSTEGDSAGTSAFYSVLTSFGIVSVAVITLF